MPLGLAASEKGLICQKLFKNYGNMELLVYAVIFSAFFWGWFLMVNFGCHVLNPTYAWVCLKQIHLSVGNIWCLNRRLKAKRFSLQNLTPLAFSEDFRNCDFWYPALCLTKLTLWQINEALIVETEAKYKQSQKHLLGLVWTLIIINHLNLHLTRQFGV